ncbi:MAG: FAD:protein FMN transferase [Eubacteriales bacterium]|nr:FAD:protein FMN transferase [Eubacteriales bacterium]
MTLLAYGDKAEEAVRAAADEIHRLDDMLSTGNVNSEISRINAAGGGEVSDVTASLILRSQELRQETGGLFEIAIYPIMKLWGFPTQEYRVPEKTEIDEALKLADASAIKVEGGAAEAAAQNPANPAEAAAAETAAAEPAQAAVGAEAIQAAAEGAGREENTENAETAPAADAAEKPAADEPEAAPADQEAAPSVPNVTFGIPGLQIDLGGIAKGYTSSRVMEIFKEHGIKHGLVSLGGNVQALGTKENGSPWRVAIQNPESEMDYLGILDIEDKCVITSGGYERFFEQDGVRYHHIIDPRTGYPAQSGLLSSTIISSDGTLADGLSTSLFIMGKEEAEKFWRAHPGQFDYILEDADGTLYVTEGAADILTTEAKTKVIK